jgi:WhiB family redox-sensing transcriptional regulator
MTTQKKTEAASGRGGYNYMDLAADFSLVDKDMNWMDSGACKGMGANEFFPERQDYHGLINAKNVCSTCKVRKRCFEWAITNEIMHGIWGGTSGKERTEYLRKQN